MWYTITRSCGHEERVQIGGPERGRKAQADREARRACAACQAREREAAALAELPEDEREYDRQGLRGQIEARIAEELHDVRSAGATAELLVGRVLAERQLREAARALGRRGGQKGGRARTEAKARAARQNGQKGGRPPRTVTRRGVYYVTTVDHGGYTREYKTSLRLDGFWCEDRQLEGTAQRSFSSLAAFRRYALSQRED